MVKAKADTVLTGQPVCTNANRRPMQGAAIRLVAGE